MRTPSALLMSFVAGVALIAAVTATARPAAAAGQIGGSGRPIPGHTSTPRAPTSQAVTGATASGPAASACSPWSLTTSKTPNSPTLYSAAAVSATNVWAVGTYFDSTLGVNQALIEHFNGSSWSLVASPSNGTTSNQLTRVMAIGPNDIWAIGQGSQVLTEHWNGTEWSVIPAPNAVDPTMGSNDITGVSAVASNDVWAVGTAASQPIVEHWNGSTWSLVTVPAPGSLANYINDVAAIASDDVWIVGTYQSSGGVAGPLFEHWNGSTWTVVPASITGWTSAVPNRVVAISSTDIWTVGYGTQTGNQYFPSMTMHWNGSTWTIVNSPNPSASTTVLNDVVALSSDNVWAVGFMGEAAPIYRLPVVMHWDGRSWKAVNTPATNAYSQFFGITGVNPLNLWAVGDIVPSSPPDYSLVERYNPLVSTTCK